MDFFHTFLASEDGVEMRFKVYFGYEFMRGLGAERTRNGVPSETESHDVKDF